jgi:excisionase family DNA binding protein
MDEHNKSAWLTVSQAAARLGVSERTIRRRCESGRLVARLVVNEAGKTWLIDESATNSMATHTEMSAPVITDAAFAAIPPATNGDGNEQSAVTGADSQITRLEGYMPQDMEIMLSRTMERAVSNVVAPLLERIESQAAAQALLMEELKELRKDRAVLKAEITKLLEEQESWPEATKAAITDAVNKTIAPYMGEVEAVWTEVNKVHQENERLKIDLEDVQNPWWKLWRGLKIV